MKKIRKIIGLLFAVSCVVSALYYVKVKMVEDTIPPEITCDKDTIEISVKDDSSVLMEGLSASDNRDGDITDSIRVDSMSHFVNGHKRFVNYVVFDKANLAGSVTRTVVYKDYTPTKIKVKEPLMYLLRDFPNVNLGENITARDCLDGNISNQVRTIIGSGFIGDAGIFDLTLQVSNSAGDVRTIPVELTLIDSDDEVSLQKEFPLLKDYILYTKVGKSVNAKDNIRGLWKAGAEYIFTNSEEESVSADDISYSTSKVNYNKPGIYTITYAYTAEDAKKAETKCYVVVEDEVNE